MSDHNSLKPMHELIDSYRSVKATPLLLTRVEAHANDANDRSLRWWLPACGAGLALAFVAIFSTNQTPSDPSLVMGQAVPGFSSLASVSSGALPTLSPSTPPSFSQLRSLERPVLPAKPVL